MRARKKAFRLGGRLRLLIDNWPAWQLCLRVPGPGFALACLKKNLIVVNHTATLEQ
jgi:hypothetical protein